VGHTDTLMSPADLPAEMDCIALASFTHTHVDTRHSAGLTADFEAELDRLGPMKWIALRLRVLHTHAATCRLYW
jgi:hypothetical protein